MKKIITVMVIWVIISMLLVGCNQAKDEVSDQADDQATDQVDDQVKDSVFVEQINLNETLSMNYDQTFSEAQLREDFEEFVSIIEKVHPKLYTDQKVLASNIDSARGAIRDQMSELDFFRTIAPIVSSLNCGHSWLSLSKESESQLRLEGSFFPLSLKWIGNKAFVYDNQGAPSIPLSAEILSINGKSTDQIRAKLFDYFTADGENQTHKAYLMNIGFNYFYKTVVDDSASFEVAYQSSGTKTEGVMMNGISNSELERLYGAMWSEDTQTYSSEFQSDYAVLSIKSFYMPGALALEEYKSFLATFFKELKDKNIRHLILDLRNNGGGDPYFTSELFNYLAKTEQPYFDESASNYYTGLKANVPLAENHYDGQLYTLMNGGSFSSTGHLLALLKYQNVGVFIGEESGASFACTDGSRSNTLPNTKLQFRGSTMIWAVEVEGLTPGRGILPDYPVVPSKEAYISEKDVEMDFALELIKNSD